MKMKKMKMNKLLMRLNPRYPELRGAKISIAGCFCDREGVCSTSDRQSLLVQFSLHVHSTGLEHQLVWAILTVIDCGCN